ncbi:uncharacterized protein LOC110621791 [Manihot esculenta]|uniref:uncharacterized protein LOC110621791 n=1 Tax=Manihot esculenta TaxID=3983 RepID=UPI001CC7A605|nr:uncharacterized protein LOC110621791 [Manihot esculenta]
MTDQSSPASRLVRACQDLLSMICSSSSFGRPPEDDFAVCWPSATLFKRNTEIGFYDFPWEDSKTCVETRKVIMIEDEKIEDSMASLETTENAEALRGKDTVERKNRQSNFRFQNVVTKLDHKPSPPGSFGSCELRNRSAHLLLLMSTCSAAMSLLGAFQLPNLLPVKVSSNHSGGMFRLLLFFNSTIFFASMALIAILMHKLPILPWLLISASSTIGAYMSLNLLQWVCSRIHII